jgi:hypothetical protein
MNPSGRKYCIEIHDDPQIFGGFEILAEIIFTRKLKHSRSKFSRSVVANALHFDPIG